jgi:hypothetical protein
VKVGVSIIEFSQSKGIKPKMRERKLRSGVNWQGALKQNGIKQGLGVVELSGASRHTVKLLSKCL